MTESPPTSQTYPDLLATLKARIRAARIRAAVSVNRELILLYWEIGRDILLRQSEEGWGTSVIDRLCRVPPSAGISSPMQLSRAISVAVAPENVRIAPENRRS